MSLSPCPFFFSFAAAPSGAAATGGTKKGQRAGKRASLGGLAGL
jgi:hypothetical protein